MALGLLSLLNAWQKLILGLAVLAAMVGLAGISMVLFVQMQDSYANPAESTHKNHLQDGFYETSFIVVSLQENGGSTFGAEDYPTFGFLQQTREGMAGQQYALLLPANDTIRQAAVPIKLRNPYDSSDERTYPGPVFIISQFTSPFHFSATGMITLRNGSNIQWVDIGIGNSGAKWLYGQANSWPTEEHNVGDKMPAPKELSQMAFFAGSERATGYPSWPENAFYINPVLPADAHTFSVVVDNVSKLVETTFQGLNSQHFSRFGAKAKYVDIMNLVQTLMPHGTWVSPAKAEGAQYLTLSARRCVGHCQNTDPVLSLKKSYAPSTHLWGEAIVDNGWYLKRSGTLDTLCRPNFGCQSKNGFQTPVVLRADLDEIVITATVTMSVFNMLSQVFSLAMTAKSIILMIFSTSIATPLIFGFPGMQFVCPRLAKRQGELKAMALAKGLQG
eukprot:TRINITY_DN24922_c0_g1_i1.p1 TRINITY_DN24922_c0_g1~~TRINITY_DN24922_c0_g1_i1.p1  ORF type:complete len:446 (+),score=40.59 TRINITY_DN24922_c0_g1_i1:88-1425(+)